MDFDTFFKQDGHVSFINKMAAFLNIAPTRVKIVSIVPGSVKISMAISEEAEEETASGEKVAKKSSSPAMDLSAMASKLTQAAKTGELTKATGFKVSEMEAEVHDTADYKPVSEVPAELRNKFLLPEEDGEGEEEEMAAKDVVVAPFPIETVLIVCAIVVGLGLILWAVNTYRKRKQGV